VHNKHFWSAPSTLQHIPKLSKGPSRAEDDSKEDEGYRGRARHGGPPGWLEESDPAGCDFVRDGRSMPPTLTDHTHMSRSGADLILNVHKHCKELHHARKACSGTLQYADLNKIVVFTGGLHWLPVYSSWSWRSIKLLQRMEWILKVFLFLFFQYFIQHWFICRLSDSTVLEDAGIEPRKVATSTLAVRRYNHSARSRTISEYWYAPADGGVQWKCSTVCDYVSPDGGVHWICSMQK